MVEHANNAIPSKVKANMNIFERQGLRWLIDAVKAGKIAITSADKGGAILVVSPDNIERTTSEILNNPARYKKIGVSNPLPACKQNLYKVWVRGLELNYRG